MNTTAYNRRRRSREHCNSSASRKDRIAHLYQEIDDWLSRALTRQVSTTEENVADACSFAWMKLVEHATVDISRPAVRGWLRTVAAREAWRLHRVDQLLSSSDQVVALADESTGPQESAVGRASVDALLAAATARQRRMLVLAALGESYQQIADAEGTTVRTVDRQLQRGRERIRSAGGPGVR
jgi:RNA polymerase sigma-70 factor (ECF subfamily)